jgi:DNA adenine methylase
MRKARSYAEVFNDLDGEVVNLFRVLRSERQAAKLAKLLDLTPFSREEFVRAYTPASSSVERARRLVIRCFMGFGTSGGKRTRTGFRDVPWRQGTSLTGVSDWMNYPPHLASFASRLRGVLIEQRPALDVIRRQDGPQTLFYVDPPYPHETRTSLAEGNTPYSYEMTDDDHRNLAMTLRDIKGVAVVSGYRCPLYDDIYAGWPRRDRASKASGDRGAVSRVESLWIHPRVAELRGALYVEAGA